MPAAPAGDLDMPNDAKLGLVAGMCIVLTVAVVYFRKEAASPADPAAAVHAPGAPAGVARAVKGKTTSLKNDEVPMTNDEGMTKPQ